MSRASGPVIVLRPQCGGASYLSCWYGRRPYVDGLPVQTSRSPRCAQAHAWLHASAAGAAGKITRARHHRKLTPTVPGIVRLLGDQAATLPFDLRGACWLTCLPGGLGLARAGAFPGLTRRGGARKTCGSSSTAKTLELNPPLEVDASRLRWPVEATALVRRAVGSHAGGRGGALRRRAPGRSAAGS